MDFKQWLEMYGSVGVFYGIFSLAYAIFFHMDVRCRQKKALQKDMRGGSPPGYLGQFSGWLGFVLVVSLLMSGWRGTAYTMFSLCFFLFRQISIYFLILLLLLPLLRRCFSAVLCAELWVLPSALYVVLYSGLRIQQWNPLPALHVELTWLRADMLILAWAVGATLVLARNVARHLIFRRSILKDASPEEDEDVLTLWQAEQEKNGFPDADLPLVRSAGVSTPLSIGFFPGTLRVVLPKRDYTAEELVLVFRHELIHISRRDASVKFFMVCCTAICWFNPLVWVAMRRSAEDMELCCDETVLLAEEASVRLRYGELLLSTAGDERGFTTCLAASAGAMRYRLRRVMAPGKRWTGGFLAGMCIFWLLVTVREVTVVFAPVSWDEMARISAPVSVELFVGNHVPYEPADQEALFSYLESLSWCDTVGYSYPAVGRPRLDIEETVWKGQHLALIGDTMVDFGDGFMLDGLRQYRCLEGVDWDYILSLFPQTEA